MAGLASDQKLVIARGAIEGNVIIDGKYAGRVLAPADMPLSCSPADASFHGPRNRQARSQPPAWNSLPVPVIVTDSEMEVHFNEAVYPLGEGENRVYGIQLLQGGIA